MKDFGFRVRTNLKYGVGVSARLGIFVKELGFHKAAIIIDAGVKSLDATAKAASSLKNEGLYVETFINDVAEPDYDYLENYKAGFMDKGFEVIIGIGGGSTMDLAKGIATLVTNPGKAIEYRGFPALKSKPLPVIAIPTTAGTGSEATYNAVFTDAAQKKKLGINSEYNFPVLAILDPSFILNCPKSVAVSSGMDALTHTLESFVHKDHTPISRIFSKEAFRLIFNSLMVMPDKPHDIEICSRLQWGAYLAGIALINAGSGPSGALSYPLGAHYKVPHGMAGAVFLSTVTEFNVSRGYQDYAELYDLIEGSVRGLSIKEKNEAFVEYMKALDEKMGIPSKLSALGLKESDVSFLIDQYDVLKKAIEQNPVDISKKDLSDMLGRMREERDLKDARI
ncbi:MAG: iron-containing alcohol dehydrogenase [Candidatus Omnitrophota bacterium]